MNKMRKALLALIFVLAYNLAQAQSQPPISPTIELPKDYQTWRGESEKLTIRNDLIAEKGRWMLIDAQTKETGKMLIIMKLNNEVVFTTLFESYSAPVPDDQNKVLITLNWLVSGGYITLSGNVIQPEIELEEMTASVWKMWEGFMKHKFNINDKEIEQLERFFPL